MSKQEFLARLKIALAGLPKDEVDERLNFYSEMIDDRMEEGFSEEAAVAGVGSMGNIVTQAVSEVPIGKLVKERIKPKRSLSGGEVALIVLVFPLWFPLLVAFLAIANPYFEPHDTFRLSAGEMFTKAMQLYISHPEWFE